MTCWCWARWPNIRSRHGGATLEPIFSTLRVRYPPSHGNLQSTALLALTAPTTVLAYSLSTAFLALIAYTTVLTY